MSDQEKPALCESAGHETKVEKLFKNFDTAKYSLAVDRGKGAVGPIEPVLVHQERIYGYGDWRGGIKRQFEWRDRRGIALGPAYRSYLLEELSVPSHLRGWVPAEDEDLHRRPTRPLSGEVYAIQRLLATFARCCDRREVRRNPAAPLNLGHRSERANEAQWELYRLMEDEDNRLLQALGYSPDANFEEEAWEASMAEYEAREGAR